MKRHYSAVLILLSSGAAGFAQLTTPNPITLNSVPSKEVGQPRLFNLTDLGNHLNPNLVEGRELYEPIGLALDTSVSPPIVYVSDNGNNRVLAWQSASSFTNGKPADLIIGQTDPFSTSAQGPATAFKASGLSSPMGLTVDKSGNLYVVDAGNNRVLRFPKPFAQTTLTPDLLIGQASFTARSATCGSSATAAGLCLNTGNAVYTAGIALDSGGNLWVVDPGNRRVLEYLAGDIANGGQGIAAKTVLGQTDFTSFQITLNSGSAQGPVTTNQFAIPSALAFDNAGRLYVADSDSNSSSSSRLNRVLVFLPSGGRFSNGQAASRIMGGGCLALALFNQTSCPAAGSRSGSELQSNPSFPYNTLLYDPEGIFLLAPDASGNQAVGVVDSGYNRILIFPPYSQWPDQSSLFSPEATGVIGQANFASNSLFANANSISTVLTPPANAGTLSAPHSAVYLPTTNELFVADSSNNRVLVMPQAASSNSGFGSATRVLGQDRLTTNSPNLIEGREFYFAPGAGQLGAAGLALDINGSVPHLYVADPLNHRVVGFYDARKVGPGSKADLIIGQPDGTTALCNYIGGLTSLGGDGNLMTDSSLCGPRGVLVDTSGNLYVADTVNARVLRFPAPFAQCPNGPGSAGCTLATMPHADLVLGQSNFNIKITDPSPASMAAPWGLAFSGTNGLFVSDAADNRVVFIPFTDTVNHTFKPGVNGVPAFKVYGQPDFVSIGTGSANNQLNAPRHIAADTSGQLYVADSGNNRVLIFPDPNNPLTPNANSQANLSLTCASFNNGSCSSSLQTPLAVTVSPTTGEVWVANSAQSTCVRFPQYKTLQFNNAPTGSVTAYGPLALAQDQYGDLFVADDANRVSVYYQGATWQNGASYFSTPMAPGAIVSLYPIASSNQFGTNTGSFDFSKFPMPTTLSDVQVTVNGTPAPLYLVSPGQINFIVPNNAPTTGNADVVVQQLSTGQILGAGVVPMNVYAPGIFMGQKLSALPNAYQAAVINNDDGSVNSQSNPVPRGHYIQIYATGPGPVPNGPADGTVPSSLTSTPITPAVLVGTCFVDDDCGNLPSDTVPPGKRVEFSGLNPSYPGVWQINVYIPQSVAPSTSTAPTPLGLTYNNTPAWNASSPWRTYIWVK